MKDTKTVAEMLEEARKKILNKETFVEFLDFCKKFYDQSFENQLLIFYQNKYANLVKPFLGWKFVGRKIKLHSRAICLCKVYKAKKTKVIDGQVDVNGKIKKERKNNKIETIGDKIIERIYVYDISDTIVDRKSEFKQPLILKNREHIDKEELYKAITQIFPKPYTEVINIDNEITNRLRGLFDFLFEDKEFSTDSNYYNIFLDSVIYLVLNFFDVSMKNDTFFKDYDKLKDLDLYRFLKFGEQLKEISREMIDCLKYRLDSKLSA